MATMNDATDLDIDSLNELNARLSQASAMLAMTYGNDGLEGWNAEIK